jgi:hypothetical protein
MKSIGFVAACVALATIGCTEYVPVNQYHIENGHVVLVVMTRDRGIYRLHDYIFTSSFVAGSGEYVGGSFRETTRFDGRIPYQEISFVGRERFSPAQIAYVLVWAIVFAGFSLLSSRRKRKARAKYLPGIGS